MIDRKHIANVNSRVWEDLEKIFWSRDRYIENAWIGAIFFT